MARGTLGLAAVVEVRRLRRLLLAQELDARERREPQAPRALPASERRDDDGGGNDGQASPRTCDGET